MSSSYRLDSLFGMSQNCFQQMRNALHSYARRVKSLDISILRIVMDEIAIRILLIEFSFFRSRHVRPMYPDSTQSSLRAYLIPSPRLCIPPRGYR